MIVLPLTLNLALQRCSIVPLVPLHLCDQMHSAVQLQDKDSKRDTETSWWLCLSNSGSDRWGAIIFFSLFLGSKHANTQRISMTSVPLTITVQNCDHKYHFLCVMFKTRQNSAWCHHLEVQKQTILRWAWEIFFNDLTIIHDSPQL